MEKINVSKGQFIIRAGSTIHKLYILVQGSVSMETKNDSFVLPVGSILGISDATSDAYACDYMALEDSVVVAYPFHSVSDYRAIFEEVPAYQYAFVHGAIMQCGQIMERYEIISNQVRDYSHKGSFMERELVENCRIHGFSSNSNHFSSLMNMVHFSAEVEDWELHYNQAFAKKDVELIKKMYAEDLDLCQGEIQHASMVMRRAIRFMEEAIEYMQSAKKAILNPEKKDYFQDFFELQKNLAKFGKDQTEVAAIMSRFIEFIENSYLSTEPLFDEFLVETRKEEYLSFDFSSIANTEEEPELEEEDEEEEEEESADCLATILEYAGKSETEIEEIRSLIEQYRDITDVYATDDDSRRIRKELTKMFFEVYEQAFFHSLEEDAEDLDDILQMFFQFGFMDVQLVGEENANVLYELTDRLYSCNSGHVYTIYRWLREVYEGKKEPSRSEFDLDYYQDLREQVKNGSLTKEAAKALERDQVAKVKYEIHNMFMTINRLTYGRITTYCPIAREEDLIKSPNEMLVTIDLLGEAMNAVRKIDFGCFYRDVLINDDKKELSKMEIKVEIMPDIILMPNAGSRGMMWQETGDVKRDSPARFMFPIMTVADITDLMIENCGRYRWEICKRVQGMRWNDIRERSLTSEYYDYLQFYRKNRDLPAEAKEKVKNSLQKCKNNYREVFVRDYVNWIKFEAKGSVRLNKVARDIIFRYCPFSKGRRRFLRESPMYRDIIEKYDIINTRNQEHISSIFSRYEKNGGEILPEMKLYLEYFDL